MYRAVTTSPTWGRTLLVVTFDEWGGFFDHVPPSAAVDVKPEYALRGFRVPCLLISPIARRGHVAHGVYDHASVLRLIEWRFRLAPQRRSAADPDPPGPASAGLPHRRGLDRRR